VYGQAQLDLGLLQPVGDVIERAARGDAFSSQQDMRLDKGLPRSSALCPPVLPILLQVVRAAWLIAKVD
jgi:hypothetical protein